nr:T9SS type A sorting domain-containing protein [uncultured Flavobacterium sp.]
MKKTLLFLFLLVSGISSAQNVEIDDQFKWYLLNYSTVDTNGDGEIQVAEAESLTSVTMDFSMYYGIPSPSIFPNLTDLTIITYSMPGGPVISLDFSTVPQLTKLDVDVSRVSSLSLSPLTQLEELYVSYQPSYAYSLPLELTGFSLGVHPQLKTFSMTGSYYAGFDSIDFSGCPLLEHITEDAYNLTAMDISVCPNLKTVDIDSFYHLESFTIGSHPNLTDFSLTGTLYTTPFQIDFGGCPSLYNLNISLAYIFGSMPGSEGAVYVNLINGNTEYSSTSQLTITNQADNTSLQTYICIDEGESDNLDINIESSPNWEAYNTVNYGSYCNFTPGGDYNTIAGSLSFDIDNDGCDVSDVIMPFTKVEINDGTTTGYSSIIDGSYKFHTQEGTFILTPQFENDWFTASPVTVTFEDNNNNIATQNFCITSNGTHNDVEVVLVPLTQAQPGFNANYKIVYRNKGNRPLNGDVTFIYNDDTLDYVSATPAVVSSATGSLSWSYSNLLPFQSGEILLTLKVNSSMEIPAVNIGDELLFAASVSPVTGDEIPGDNTFGLKQTVVSSLAPNDITCLQGAIVAPEMIGEYLHYNINFENIGTAAATFVTIKEIVDTTKYDISTLQVLNMSHAMETRITDNNLEFYFNNINLAANGGKGNVAFKIKTLNSLVVNSSVTQKANIYFDYNWPIVTNDAVTTFEVLNTNVVTKDSTVKVYPNPTKDVVKVSAASVINLLQLFDLQSRMLQSQQYDDTTAQVDLSGRAAGVYFVKVFTEKGASVQKVIKE